MGGMGSCGAKNETEQIPVRGPSASVSWTLADLGKSCAVVDTHRPMPKVGAMCPAWHGYNQSREGGLFRVLMLSLDVVEERLHIQYVPDPKCQEYAQMENTLSTAVHHVFPHELCNIILQYQQPLFNEHLRDLYNAMCSLGITFHICGYAVDRNRIISKFFPEFYQNVVSLHETKDDVKRGLGEIAAADRLVLPLSLESLVGRGKYRVYLYEIKEMAVKVSRHSQQDNSGYIDINAARFEEAYNQFYRFLWIHGRHSNCLGICFFAGLMLGAKASIDLKFNQDRHSLPDIQFSPE